MASSSSASRKRQRIVDDDNYVHCTIRGPKGAMIIGPLFESEEDWPAYTISFRRSMKPTFFNLWSKLSSVMLYADNHDTPFTDMNCLLEELEHVEFRLGEWTEEYAALHDRLNDMCDERAVANLDGDINRLQAAISQKEQKRAIVVAKIQARKRARNPKVIQDF